MIDRRLLDAYIAWGEERVRRGILDHRLDTYCLDGLTIEAAMRKILDEDGVEVPE